jgi:nicotinic acid mononucleotide adenylyltransferase
VPDLPPISSTQIRAALARGENPAHLVPAAVLAYIRTHQLYTAADGDGQV